MSFEAKMLVVVAVTLLVLAGCSTLEDWLHGKCEWELQCKSVEVK